MKSEDFRRTLILYLAAAGGAVWPVTWFFLLRDAMSLRHPQLWQDYSSPGFIMLVFSAFIGTCSLAVYIIVATKRDADEDDQNPAAFHGTARFATRSEVAELTAPAEQLGPRQFHPERGWTRRAH